jgi:hypothetical protein
MRKIVIYLIAIILISFSSCAQKLTNTKNLSTNQKGAVYKKMKDVLYGSDAEKETGIYLSAKAKNSGKNSFKIVFLQGEDYYLNAESQEKNNIEPYLKKGNHVVNLTYRLKKEVAIATSDSSYALTFLTSNNSIYPLNLPNIVLTGFSSRAHIATNIGLSKNNTEFLNNLIEGTANTEIIKFSGCLDGLDISEKKFNDKDDDMLAIVAKAIFLSNHYELKGKIAVYEPISCFAKDDPPIFWWRA